MGYPSCCPVWQVPDGMSCMGAPIDWNNGECWDAVLQLIISARWLNFQWSHYNTAHWWASVYCEHTQHCHPLKCWNPVTNVWWQWSSLSLFCDVDVSSLSPLNVDNASSPSPLNVDNVSSLSLLNDDTLSLRNDDTLSLRNDDTLSLLNDSVKFTVTN